jgi:hypothetical protein
LIALAGCGYAAAGTAAGASTAVCANAARVDRLTVDRLNLLHQDFHFVIPAHLTVTDAHQAQTVARALCALPPAGHRVYFCPADWGIRYQLRFAVRQHWLRPVTLDATGCTMASGLGPVRWISGSFWHKLGIAAGLRNASFATFTGGPGA